MVAKAVRQKITSKSAERSRKKFLRFFPGGFRDETYLAWERGYKWQAHERWQELLPRSMFKNLLRDENYPEIGARALKTLSGTNLIFSFESMALRDALRSAAGSLRSRTGAHMFSEGLYEFLYGRTSMPKRFDEWCRVLASLPKKQSRVFTHPVATVFGFLAQPDIHFFFKPMVTKRAAERYGFDLHYHSRPSWEVYESVLEFASVVNRDLADLKPRDMIDIQSFVWVIGSEEYE